MLVLLLLSFDGLTQGVRFHQMNKELGISIRETNEICSDYNGFIWASSKMGVIRLTEENYKIYQLPYASPDVITVKLAYFNKHLYSYTNNGQVFFYDPVKDEFSLIINLALEINNYYLSVNRILVDEMNRLLIASSEGLFIYKDGVLVKDAYYDFNLEQIAWHSKDNLWLVSNTGIYNYHLSSSLTDTVYLKSSNEKFLVSSIFYDHVSGKLWLGTLANGVCVLKTEINTPRLEYIQNLPEQPVLAIEALNDSILMIGIDGQGIRTVNMESAGILDSYKENIDDPGSLPGNGVYDIFCDESNKVWVSTFSGGLSYFDQGKHVIRQYTHQINNKNSLVNNDVNDVHEDNTGKIWFATNNGLSVYNPVKDSWSSLNEDMNFGAHVFTSLCEDDNGNIWAGTYSSGVYLFDQHSGRELKHYEMGSPGTEGLSDYIFSIYKDYKGDMWIGGVQGNLVCYLQQEKKFRSYAFLPVNVLKEFEPGIMLAGCTFGLVKIDKYSGETDNLLEGYLIQDILIAEGHIWLCTSGDGLIRFNPSNREVRKYSTDDGLLSNFVNSAFHTDGFIWLGTERGLCRLDPLTGSISVFSSEPILTGSSFNSKANCLLENGELLWGSNNGAILFDPALMVNIQPKGKMFFQDILLSGTSLRGITDFDLDRPLDSLREISLNYHQNTVAIELLAMGPFAKGAKFSWILEAVDKSWSQPGSVRTISYANLPSGNFSLKIRMYDSSLSQMIEERELSILITPPFWAAWWFKLSIVLFIAGLLGFALVQYINYLKKQHSEQKIRFFAGVAHDIRTSVTLINSPVEELNKETKLSEHGRYYLNLAIEQSRQLSKVVTQLMDFQKVDVGKEELSLVMLDIVTLMHGRVQIFQSLAARKDIRLNFMSNQKSFLTAVDEIKIEKVVDNLISNAVKYSKKGDNISIDLHVSDLRWLLNVRDQGIGISGKSQRKLFREFYRGENAVNSKIVGSGIGLVLAKKYVKMHKGRISCTSHENQGTLIQVVIPYKSVEKVRTPESLPEEIFDEMRVNQSAQTAIIKPEEKTNRKKRLLIAEDNDDLRIFLQTALEVDFNIIHTSNGDDAWKQVLKDMPDVIISDIMMPGMDGFELCKIIKSTYDTSHIPVVLLTSLAGQAEELHGLGLGADDYLTKPFDIAVLIQRIKSILKNRERIREKAMKYMHGERNEAVLSNELNDKFVKKMLEVVKMNISNPEFNKELFAAEMNVSSSLLYKKSKALTDLSPSDFIRAIRMDHALQLIKENRNSITEISIMCGYSSIAYFSTVFKNFYGKSPTEIFSS